jgi:malonate-semialdehyde dehydrogenase (acetylating) / methylmalonate-semialdehyde dehydrogenase
VTTTVERGAGDSAGTTSGRYAVRNFIGGRWETPSAAHSEPVYNPATGEVIAETPLSTAADVDRAVQAAARAYPGWSSTPVVQRIQILFRFKALLEAHFDEIGAMVTLENGKGIGDATGEVRRGIEVVEFACGMPTLMMGETVRNVANGIDNVSYRFPLGVVAAIVPFNFPAMIPLWTMPIAIGAGNTYVLKPSERTPLSSQRIVELLVEAGLPEGVVNIVHGARDAVNGILEHPDVRAVSFVGSRPTAEYIYRTAAAHGKRVQALSGAKNSLIVMPDAVLGKTIENVMSSAFGNAGERCLAGSVVVAVGTKAEQFIEALRERARALVVGPGNDPKSELTPLIRESHRENVKRYVDVGESEGAQVILDGRTPPRPEGFYLGPTLLDRATGEMRVAREEIFGPVLSIVRARTLDDAIGFTNGSPFGNACSIFTDSGAAARHFREHIQAGMLGINIGVAGPMAFFPFNGIKGSFFGDLHAMGKDGVRFFTENKVEAVRWFSRPEAARSLDALTEAGA